MKIVIFGLGSVGKRHAKILKECFDVELFAFRSGSHSGNDLGITELYNWKDVENQKADAAFITNPTSRHIETALKCASAGMHLFIEKPLSDSMEGVDELAGICREKKLTCYTAYCLRFHPVIKEIKNLISGKGVLHVRAVCSSYLPSWRQETNSKDTYSASKRLGGGVLLDLSHEFDYISYLFGQIDEIKGFFGRASEVTVDAEDFADVSIKTKKMICVSLHINFLSRLNERMFIVDYEGGYMVGDLIESKIEASNGNKKETMTFSSDRDAYFKEQTQYFFNNMGKPEIMNDITESSELLRKILEFKNAKQ